MKVELEKHFLERMFEQTLSLKLRHLGHAIIFLICSQKFSSIFKKSTKLAYQVHVEAFTFGWKVWPGGPKLGPIICGGG